MHVMYTQLASCHAPHAGSGVVRMDPLHFLAGCRKRRLNQALSVLCLGLSSFSVFRWLLGPLFVFC